MKSNRTGKILLLLFTGCSLLIFTAVILLFGWNRFSLKIRLKGEEEMTLPSGEAYQEQGSSASWSGTRILRDAHPLEDEPEIQGTVPENQVGTFYLTYRLQKLWMETEAVRTVHIVDEVAPEITLVGGDQELTPGVPYVEEGYKASDNADGDLTDRVIRKEYQGEIHYTVTDSSGNTTTVIRKATTFDITPPVITMKGGSEIKIFYGAPWMDPGCSAEDESLGDVTDRIIVEGEVNSWIPGTYTLTYTAADDEENTAVSIRKVTVAAAPRMKEVLPDQKTIYLTFDDGPGPYTDYLLDVLKKNNVKATFFVVGQGHSREMQRIVNEGHSIAVHSVTHQYRQIYASPEAFFQDLFGMQKIIEDNTGVKTYLMRFPGGSSNMVSSFSPGIMTTLTERVQDAGFQYFDWNVDSNDAGGASTAEEVYENVIEGYRNHRVSVVLQHDIHGFSVLAVEKIIQWGKANGYQFLPLDSTSCGAHHGGNN